jgi:hypothetical protein
VLEVNFFIEFPHCLIWIFAFLIRTWTRLVIALIDVVKLLEPNVIALFDFLDILFKFKKLTIVFCGGIADDEFCEVFGDEKLLFDYFIEGRFESSQFLYCFAIVFEDTPAYSFDRGL